MHDVLILHLKATRDPSNNPRGAFIAFNKHGEPVDGWWDCDRGILSVPERFREQASRCTTIGTDMNTLDRLSRVIRANDLWDDAV